MRHKKLDKRLMTKDERQTLILLMIFNSSFVIIFYLNTICLSASSLIKIKIKMVNVINDEPP